MDKIRPWINGIGKEEVSDTTTKSELAVFSGHDTTIMPLLASLDGRLWNNSDWAPYASMLLIEVSFAFVSLLS